MNPIRLFLALALACQAQAGQAQSRAPLRDPFARPAAASAPAPGAAAAEQAAPVLRAVMIAPGQSIANIGGHIVSVGDALGPYRVQRIDERSVTLAQGKTRTVLQLDRESRE